MKRIEVHNELTDRRYKCEKETDKANDWLAKKIERNTFGLGERWVREDNLTPEEIETSLETREVVLVPAVTVDVYESEEQEFFNEETGETTMVEQPVKDADGNYTVIGEEVVEQAVTVTEHKRPAQYTITETDITAEHEEKENKRQKRKQKKQTAENKLAKILDNTKFDFSDPKDVKKAFRRVLNYLEIDLDGDDE